MLMFPEPSVSINLNSVRKSASVMVAGAILPPFRTAVVNSFRSSTPLASSSYRLNISAGSIFAPPILDTEIDCSFFFSMWTCLSASAFVFICRATGFGLGPGEVFPSLPHTNAIISSMFMSPEPSVSTNAKSVHKSASVSILDGSFPPSRTAVRNSGRFKHPFPFASYTLNNCATLSVTLSALS